MLSQQCLSKATPTPLSFQNPPFPIPKYPILSFSKLSLSRPQPTFLMASSSHFSNGVEALPLDSELDRFGQVANKVADASGQVIRKYFRKKFEILDKADLSKFCFVQTSTVRLLRKYTDVLLSKPHF